MIAGRSRAEWAELVKHQDVMLEPVNDLGEASQDPQLIARGLLLDVDGPIPQPAPMVRLEDGYHADPRVAAHGEDTDSVLAEVGYSVEQIAALRKSGVI